MEGERILDLNELENVTGGVAVVTAAGEDTPRVEATCEHCGTRGMHLMETGRTAICLKCGKVINLIAQ